MLMAAENPKTGTFGEFIRLHRKQQNLTQSDLVRELAQRGTKLYNDVSAVHWEKGRAMPPISDPKFVKALADVLGVSESEILAAAGFSLDANAPDELPPDIEQMLRSATPAQRKKALAMLRLMLDAANDENAHQP